MAKRALRLRWGDAMAIVDHDHIAHTLDAGQGRWSYFDFDEIRFSVQGIPDELA